MKNIFQIWEENNKKIPFCVSKGNWSNPDVYVIVKEVIPDGKGYGEAFGIPVTEGIINNYFEHSAKWKYKRIIPSAGTYNWKSRFEKSTEIKNSCNFKNEKTEEKNIYNLRDKIPFGKFKGKTIEEICNLDSSYLVWAIKNVRDFNLSDDILKLINK